MHFAKQGCRRRAAHHSEQGMGFGGFSCCMYQVSLHRETVENNERIKSLIALRFLPSMCRGRK